MTPTEPRRTAAWFWLLVPLLAFVGWRALSLGMADRQWRGDAEGALAWRADHPRALLRQAEVLSRAPDTADEAARLARRALAAHPLDGRGHRLLGQLADAGGDRDAAFAHYTRAGQRARRDAATSAWLADWNFSRGQFAEGLVFLDRLLRARPGAARDLRPVLSRLATAPGAQPALAEALSRQPPWRGALVVGAIQDPEAPVQALDGLVQRLRQAPGGLQPQELEAWVDRLGREGQWGSAYLVWVSHLSPDQLAVLGNVYNGGFELPPGRGGFDWRLGRIAGARMDRLPTPGASGALALRVAFEDRRVPFNHLRQQLALAPGRYELVGRARPEHLRTERGLVWTVACNGGPALGDSPPLRGGGNWREFRLEFEVPADGCGGQWLSLRLPARIPAEQRIGGAIWFDDVAIRRLP